MIDILLMDVSLEDFKALEPGLKNVRIIEIGDGFFYKTGRLPCETPIRLDSERFRASI